MGLMRENLRRFSVLIGVYPHGYGYIYRISDLVVRVYRCKPVGDSYAYVTYTLVERGKWSFKYIDKHMLLLNLKRFK